LGTLRPIGVSGSGSFTSEIAAFFTRHGLSRLVIEGEVPDNRQGVS